MINIFTFSDTACMVSLIFIFFSDLYLWCPFMRNMSLLLAVHVLHLWSYFAFRARVRRTEWRFLSDSQHRSRWEPSTARTAHPEPRQSESSSSSDLSTPSDRWCPAIWWTVPRSEQTKKRPTSLISLNLRYQKFIIRITNTARRNAVTLLFFFFYIYFINVRSCAAIFQQNHNSSNKCFSVHTTCNRCEKYTVCGEK